MIRDTALRERRGPAFHVTLKRPEQRNAINNDVISGIASGISKAQARLDLSRFRGARSAR